MTVLLTRLSRLLRPLRPLPPPPAGWDARQLAVIEAPAGARLLVDGGPGTGKTAVACARVAHLIRGAGLPPESVWIVSFTRTAIREVRDRLAAAIGNGDMAARVRVSTLDSLAWALQPDPEPDGSYDESIVRVLAAMRTGGAIVAGLAALRHVVVDEAHDIVGPRAELVAALVSRLPAACGVTAFADPAQAIYGFAEGAAAAQPLVDWLRTAPSFTPAALETLFRSRAPGLARIFRDTRARLLAPDEAPHRVLARVRGEVEALADGAATRLDPAQLAGRDDVLVLFRRRAETLRASARLHEAGVAHRLRLSGFTAGPAPWIAAALADIPGQAFGRDAFLAAWHRRVAGGPLAVLDPVEAWERLARATRARAGTIEAARLSRVLAAAQPPAELCGGDPGWGGPLLGTIHASKGREADTVHLMLAPPAGGAGFDEEARVLFVGATRARRTLVVGRAEAGGGYGRLEGGRLWRAEAVPPLGAVVELGRDGDLDAEGVAGRRHFADAAAVRDTQARLLALAGRTVTLTARRMGGGYGLVTAGDPAPLAFLSAAAAHDLHTVSRLLTVGPAGPPVGPPEAIGGLALLGLTSMAAPTGRDLHAPWADGVPLLVPLVAGFAPVTFPVLGRRNPRA